MPGERIWKLAAWILSAVAVAASLNTGLSASRQREIISQKQADLQQIQAYSGRWAREDALRAGLEARQAWAPADLEALAVRFFGVQAVKVVPRPATSAAGGWQCRETSLDLRDVTYAEAGLFLAAAAENPPAWRLREMEIKPSAEGGKGAMALVLEALEKKQP